MHKAGTSQERARQRPPRSGAAALQSPRVVRLLLGDLAHIASNLFHHPLLLLLLLLVMLIVMVARHKGA